MTVHKIICPNCGAEYLPCEIFIPDVFIGKSYHVDRDKDGKIITFDGEAPDVKESFQCYRCGRKFNVDTEINFKTSFENFSATYTTKIKKPQLFMKED